VVPPAPVPVVTTTVPATVVDRSGDPLGTVPGRTTVTIGITPGKATLNGTVAGPDGAPVPGADVHLERVVGDQQATADVTSQPDGTWSAPGVLGGLYRIRAWRVPDLAQTTPTIVFVLATETRTLALRLDRFGQVQVTSSVAPSPPVVGQPSQVVVEVTAATVGPDGVVRGQGRPGSVVELVAAGQWTIVGAVSQTTPASSIVAWRVTCDAVGAQGLSVLVNATDAFTLDVPACAPPAPPPTAPPTSPPTSAPVSGPTTGVSTTAPSPRPTTTVRPTH